MVTGPSRSEPVVQLYTRVCCGLCERAARLVAREAGRCEILTHDVDTDPELARRYGVRVPVVVVDGIEVAELEVASGQVRRGVRAARRIRRRGR
jgi:thioredoxin-like negative regulator of GroEL